MRILLQTFLKYFRYINLFIIMSLLFRGISLSQWNGHWEIPFDCVVEIKRIARLMFVLMIFESVLLFLDINNFANLPIIANLIYAFFIIISAAFVVVVFKGQENVLIQLQGQKQLSLFFRSSEIWGVFLAFARAYLLTLKRLMIL